MGYALSIAIAAVFACTLVAFALRLVRSKDGVRLVGGWRWHPSLLGLSVALLVAGLLLWRFFPEIVILPIIVPIFWWGCWSPKRRDQAERDGAQGRLPPPDHR